MNSAFVNCNREGHLNTSSGEGWSWTGTAASGRAWAPSGWHLPPVWPSSDFSALGSPRLQAAALFTTTRTQVQPGSRDPTQLLAHTPQARVVPIRLIAAQRAGDHWEPQSGQLGLQRANARHSTPGPDSALLPNSQQSVPVGASFHTLSPGLSSFLPHPHSTEAPGSAHETPFLLQTGEEGCHTSYLFVPLRETRSAL